MSIEKFMYCMHWIASAYNLKSTKKRTKKNQKIYGLNWSFRVEITIWSRATLFYFILFYFIITKWNCTPDFNCKSIVWNDTIRHNFTFISLQKKRRQFHQKPKTFIWISENFAQKKLAPNLTSSQTYTLYNCVESYTKKNSAITTKCTSNCIECEWRTRHTVYYLFALERHTMRFNFSLMQQIFSLQDFRSLVSKR